MKALSLTQPYAILIALGGKKIETRSWGTSYRGPLAIHAASGYGKGGKRAHKELCGTEPFCSVLNAAGRRWLAQRGDLRDMVEHPFMPMGAIVATCTLIDVRRMPPNVANLALWGYTSADGARTLEWPLTDQERAFGAYSPGRYAWLLADIRALPEPIAAKGKLGLWEYDGPLPNC